MARSRTATNPRQATTIFAALGALAVERGRDASGFAATPALPHAKTRRATERTANATSGMLGQVTVVKDVKPFTDLWDIARHGPLVDESRVIVGHTRWATQGDKKKVANASPVTTGTIIGTHNGDVTPRTVPDHYLLPRQFGGTDTEHLFQSIHRARKDRRKITAVLRESQGRIAAAWLDQEHPDRLYLARAALSPLSIAYDRDGNLYWASNPNWFRLIDDALGGKAGFHSLTIVKEGVLLTVDVSGDEPVLADLRTFTPRCRSKDMRLAGFAVWRGFESIDETLDRAQGNRKVVADPKPLFKSVTAAKTGTARQSAAVFQKRWVTPGLGDTLQSTYQTAIDRWATEPDWWEETGWDDNPDAAFVTPDSDPDWEAHTLAVDEADAAIIQWAEEGMSEDVVNRLRADTSLDAMQQYANELGLSSLDVYYLFREGVLEWWFDENGDAELPTVTA